MNSGRFGCVISMLQMARKAYAVFIVIGMFVAPGCGSNRDGGRTLLADTDITDEDGSANDKPADGDKSNELFMNVPGTTIPIEKVQKIASDPTGNNILNDYDGDGIKNEDETVTNPYVSDTPRIVTRISPPITMEVRVSSVSSDANHVETVEDSDVTDTITNSMEDRQYSSLNRKTTPYMSKESQSISDSASSSWGTDDETSVGGTVSCGGFWGDASTSFNFASKHARNESWSNAFSKSTSSEKMAFIDADYIDNMSRNGTAFTDETVEKITKNSRKSEVLKKTDSIGPEAGIVRTSFFIQNETINIPAHISNVKCTLTFKTPDGRFLPVKTFLLRNEDYTLFEQDVYGNEELGPYTIAVDGLNTNEVTRALKKGYVPQIHVVSFDMGRVKDSNYNPGVDNLRIVEEQAKGRTALIKISGSDMRETYRVCAFDEDDKGNIVTGISLKKALFNIFYSRTANGEKFERDINRMELTVKDSGLKWKKGAVDESRYTYGANTTGNAWRLFETYVKTYEDDDNSVKRIETIKRIGPLQKYNPFDKEDNPGYDPNELLSEREIRKMKYWYVFHNGKYYEGDINDPIWPGDRYEIVCVDVNDFNDHFVSYNYTPMQSENEVTLGTRWNSISNEGEFARAKYLGKLYQDDKVVLEIDLKETRYLADPAAVSGSSDVWDSNDPGLKYRIGSEEQVKTGKPSDFSYVAYPGVNSISVAIADSDNANAYEVILYKYNEKTFRYDNFATFDRTSDALIKSGNVFTINSKSIPRAESVGEFLSQGLVAGSYKIYIKSWGKLYGVDVSCSSSSNGQIVNVPDAENRIPGNFTAIVSGQSQSISIDIGSGGNTELFEVNVTGPMNYGPGGCSSTRKYYVSAGYNTIDVDTPPVTAVFDSKIASGEPGVYNIEIYPLNKFYATGSSVSSVYHDRVHVTTVYFDKYSKQKSLRADIWDAPSMIESLNLEVNFNDSPLWYPFEGNAWYRLRFSNYDKRPGKFIDCSSTYYIDYKKQKFYVSFAPPAGTCGSVFNVFSGGRDTVDLYIRTSALPEYRDRFWPRPDSGVVVRYPDSREYFSGWFSGEMNDMTDATSAESVLMNYAGAGKLISSSEIADYFFSPFEYRKIGISARLSGDQMALAEQERVDCAVFDLPFVDGDRSITVPNIRSAYCNRYEVHYKQSSDDPDALLNENVMLWPKAASDVSANSGSCTIRNLEPNKRYAIAVIGYKVLPSGSEKTKGYVLNVDSDNHVVTLIPRTTAIPKAPSSFIGGLKDGENTIVVSNVFSTGATHYRVYYRETGSTVWNSTAIKSNEGGPVDFEIPSLEAWTGYEIIPAAINMYTPGNENPESIEMNTWSKSPIVSINTEFRMKNNIIIEWFDLNYAGVITGSKIYSEVFPDFTDWGSLRNSNISGGLRIKFSPAELPDNAIKYKLRYRMRYLRIGHNCESGYWTRLERSYDEIQYNDIKPLNEYIILTPRLLYARNFNQISSAEDTSNNGSLCPGFYEGADRVFTYYMVRIDYTINLLNKDGKIIEMNRSVFLPNFYPTREIDPVTGIQYWCGYGWESVYLYE